MKIRNIMYGSMLAGVVLAAQSCEKIEDFRDINVDPNVTTQPVTAALLTNTIANLGNNVVWDQGGLNTVAGLYAQYFSETQYTEQSRYAKPSFNWDAYYAGPLFDLQTIINYASDPATAGTAGAYGDVENQIAVARILRAQYYKFLTDQYGDLPYSQALQGSGTLEYDQQEAIYTDLLNELKEAAEQLDVNPTIALQGDIMYQGNIANWRRYANSLRALIALNMSKANATLGRTEFADAIADGVIDETSENATIDYPGGNFRNPFYNYYNVTSRRDFGVSKTVTDFMAANGDERISAIASSSVGVPYGLSREQATAFTGANNNWARIMGEGFDEENSPLTVLSAANVYLARAEAAQRGWTGESVAALYQSGIRESWEQWGVYNATDFTAYMARPAVALTPGTELQKIATQEWLAWYPNGVEGWNVWRRTGFPVLTPAAGAGDIPRRITYGPQEYSLNPTNVAAAGGRYNVGGTPDSQYGRIWWDQ